MTVQKTSTHKKFNLPKLALGAIVLLFSAQQANAISFNGSFQASQEEISHHKSQISNMARIVKKCLSENYDYHVSFYRRHGISPYYGSNSAFSRRSYSSKKSYLRSLGLNPALLSKMSSTSCVGLASKCYERAFKQTGQTAVWNRIKKYAGRNDWDGSAIVEAYRSLGWHVMLWNPDPSQNAAWDKQERASVTRGAWGWHADRYRSAVRHGRYYQNNVDDAVSMVGFGTRPPAVIMDAPMFIGVAHTGYHVFAGFKGYVIEAHSTRRIKDPNTLEAAEFNPIANGGAPRGKYRSGLVAVPPGYEPRSHRTPRRSFWNW